MTLQFCGAARTVTGSCHLLTLDDGYTILLDCGLYQGNEEDFDDFNVEWLFEPSRIDAVILSHAHIDHCGRLPKLVKDGFGGTIYATPATHDLAAIMLLDSAFIQEKDAQWQNKKQSRSGDNAVEPL
jgi:metallo-beta-lactamase family protein